MIVIKRARERGGYEKGLDESSNQNLEVEGHCARKNELTKQALCKVVTNDIFALECLHSILSNCDSVLMSTVQTISGSLQNRGRNAFHFLSIAMFHAASRSCPTLQISLLVHLETAH